VERFGGPWANPNLFGVMMATGLALALGVIFSIPDLSRRSFCIVLLCLGATVPLSYGVIQSYSRGAWLGLLLGVVYLVHRCFIIPPCIQKHRRSLRIVALSIVILFSWHLQPIEWRVLQRASNFINGDDFSRLIVLIEPVFNHQDVSPQPTAILCESYAPSCDCVNVLSQIRITTAATIPIFTSMSTETVVFVEICGDVPTVVPFSSRRIYVGTFSILIANGEVETVSDWNVASQVSVEQVLWLRMRSGIVSCRLVACAGR